MFFTNSYWSMGLSFRKCEFQLGVFSNISKYNFCCCFITTAIIFIWGDRGYPAVHFEYKTASERYLVVELWAKQFWMFLKKLKFRIFPQNTQNCFAYISATKYCSGAVLYSKQTAGYPLSPHIKIIAVAFLRAEW